MQASKLFGTPYRLSATFVMAVALVILAYHLFSHTLFSGIGQPLFLFNQPETFYYLFSLTHIAQFITSNSIIAAIADVVLFLLPLLFLFTGERPFIIAFTILVLIYFLTFNLVTGHHYHALVGVIIITIPFWFMREDKFDLAWQMVRYYLLYIFASAALWKIFRGSAFYPDQLVSILKAQHLDLLLQDPNSLKARIATYLITHSTTAHWLLSLNVLLQLSFLIGFFTKRFDTILFWLAIAFCIGNYFVMNIISTELLILDLALLNWDYIYQMRLNKP